MSVRAFLRRQKLALIRSTVRLIARDGGAAVWLTELYDLGLKDPALGEWLIRTEICDVFRSLYMPSIHNPVLAPYFRERGVDDLYRYAYVLAQQGKLPLAQRAECFSQEGEDLIVGRLFEGQKSGFFVDVGAHHPFRFSNTWLLYRRGWRGINIDATPGVMDEFRRWRPEDINIECLVSMDTKPRPYFLHDEPALNTMSEELVKRRAVESPQFKMREIIMLEAKPLSAILAQYLPEGLKVDFLNVDVEGHDLDVLQTNDWAKFRPRVIAAEMLATGLGDVEKNEVYRFLTERGYSLFAKMFNSAIFISG